MAVTPERFSVHALFQSLRSHRQLLELVDAAHIIRATAAKLSRSTAGVHGDLIPENIVIDQLKGDVQLVGFGNTRVDTSSKAPADRLRYLSPERARGEPATAATDTFSLGLIFWRLIYGRDLISGANPTEILEKLKAFSAPAFPATPQVPAEILSLLGQMLAPHPAGRLAANEIQEALSMMIARREPTSTPTSCNLRLANLIKNLIHDPLSGILTGDKSIDLALPKFESPPFRWKRFVLVGALVVGALVQRYYTTFVNKGASSVGPAMQTDFKILLYKSKTAIEKLGADAPSTHPSAEPSKGATPKTVQEPSPADKKLETISDIVPFRIDSTPRGAHVYIDQKPTTYYTPAVLEIHSGTSLLITLKRKGYQDCSALMNARVGVFTCILEK